MGRRPRIWTLDYGRVEKRVMNGAVAAWHISRQSPPKAGHMVYRLCLNTGCVPSKALIKSARLAHSMRHADHYGLEATTPRFSFRKVMQRVHEDDVAALAMEMGYESLIIPMRWDEQFRRTTSTGWKNEVGEWSNPAIVNILRNSEDRQRFLADATVKAFIKEQGLLDDYLFARVKQQRRDLLQLPLLQTKSGRPSKAKILAYLYQHGETDIMNVVREVAAIHGHDPLASIHDAIVFRKKLGVDLKSEIELRMREYSGNPYWHLTAKQLERYTPRLLDVEQEERSHRMRMQAEEVKAQEVYAELALVLEE
jgi:hypothetical protein